MELDERNLHEIELDEYIGIFRILFTKSTILPQDYVSYYSRGRSVDEYREADPQELQFVEDCLTRTKNKLTDLISRGVLSVAGIKESANIYGRKL